MKAERAELAEVVAAYENAKDSGDHRPLQKRAGSDAGLTLIVARIAKGMSQRDLAWRLGVKEQQVQRYEATQYRGVAAERLQEVADALHLRVREVFTLEKK